MLAQRDSAQDGEVWERKTLYVENLAYRPLPDAFENIEHYIVSKVSTSVTLYPPLFILNSVSQACAYFCYCVCRQSSSISTDHRVFSARFLSPGKDSWTLNSLRMRTPKFSMMYLLKLDLEESQVNMTNNNIQTGCKVIALSSVIRTY